MSEDAERKTFKLSDKLSVEFTINGSYMTAEWDPEIPKKFTAEEVKAYRAARGEMLQRLADRIGGAVACVEVG